MKVNLKFSERRRAYPLRQVSLLMVLTLLLTNFLFISPASTRAADEVITAHCPSGMPACLIQIPPNWNGTLLLWSHGYQNPFPYAEYPVQDAPDENMAAYLLSQGFALAGSSYSTIGWAVEKAIPEQKQLLDYFSKTYHTPSSTIAWGASLGGMITAGLVQRYPDKFVGAMSMCGVVGGGVGTWNLALDGQFVFKTLLAPNSDLRLVHIVDPGGNFNQAAMNIYQAQIVLAQAASTPQGRAKLALVGAIAQIPDWYFNNLPHPSDLDNQLEAQITYLREITINFAFGFRADLEMKALGNPSWNYDIDYSHQLDLSGQRSKVEYYYAQAGLDLKEDLKTLAAAPRIYPDFQALNYLKDNITFNGDVKIPVLTMHTTHDGLVVAQEEQTYDKLVKRAGNNQYLRQLYVEHANHCSFTGGEVLTGLNILMNRVVAGKWNGEALSVPALNKSANQIAPGAAFIQYNPGAFLRAYP